jgi:hypothetical protein
MPIATATNSRMRKIRRLIEAVERASSNER